MKKLNFLLALAAVCGALVACGGAATQQGDDTNADSGEKAKAYDLTFTPAGASTQYADAALTLNAPEGGSTLPSGEPVSFSFGVESADYTLGAQTPDAETRGCANSGKGQHIHLILNNGPYMAKYESDFDVELADGYYVALAFLSRSYHESIKSNTAFQVFDFQVGEGEYEPADLYGEHLFYSRPKGEYVGEDAKKLLLDFYLYNTQLSDKGDRVRKVRVSVDGEEYFQATEWQPYFIEGLPMGEHTVKIELVDSTGTVIGNNMVERKITLTELK